MKGSMTIGMMLAVVSSVNTKQPREQTPGLTDAGYLATGSSDDAHVSFQSRRFFETIEPVRDLGIFCWDPEGLTQKEFRDVSVEDVVDGLHQQEQQPPQHIRLQDIRVPVQFFDPKKLPAQEVLNVFPHDPGYIVHLFVAKNRGLDLSQVDFVLGGSTLNMLATEEIEKSDSAGDVKYLVQKCPTTDILVVVRHHRYRSNRADIGFQFERLMTGHNFSDRHDACTFEHLHVMKLAGYTILFAAEVDAVESSGKPIEIKAGNPRYFAMRVMFQMLSNGAVSLIMANRTGQTLQGIEARSFTDMAREHNTSRLKAAEENIVKALRQLKKSTLITEDAATELFFYRGRMLLQGFNGNSLLPKASVVKALFAREQGDMDRLQSAIRGLRLGAERRPATRADKTAVVSNGLAKKTLAGAGHPTLSTRFDDNSFFIQFALMTFIFSGSGVALAACRPYRIFIARRYPLLASSDSENT